jgi:quinol monooxygenase YgiN
MAGVCVIVAYRPKPGKEAELHSLARARVPMLRQEGLRQEGLAPERAPIIMRTKDGTLLEVSEWKSRAGIEAAHQNPNVLAMWNRFFAACDCIPLNTLAEAEEMFAGFEPVDG